MASQCELIVKNSRMMSSRARLLLIGFGLAVAAAIGAVASQLPTLGASALLYPFRRHVDAAPPESCRQATFSGVGVKLAGWRCSASGLRRGTLVYLHGIADNRASSDGVIRRFGQLGLDVVAYDSRAHGDSGGEACTYGFLEKQDLRRVLDTVDSGPVVLLGTSLGAAVALQSAAEDGRVSAVVAAETFSDLRTVATERAPFFFTADAIARAFQVAESRGHFQVDAVSPVVAAAKITVPVLLIHGDADIDTSPDHSRRVFATLRGPRQLVLVPGAMHNGSLRPEIWDQIQRWVVDVLAAQPGAHDERGGG
jgi:pimeloyl-ACP methyl ester carboxylesterase